MPDIQQFRLPDVGEGLTEAEIVSWKVVAGQVIEVNHPILEIETAKSLVELPSPLAGRVTQLLVPEGATVDVGTPLISVDVDPAGRAQPPGGPVSAGGPPVLVGYGPHDAGARRRPRVRPAGPPAGGPAGLPGTDGAPARVLATPPVRKLAHDLGIDLSGCTPTGPSGTVTREDVLARSSVGPPEPEPEPEPGAEGSGAPRGDRETRTPIRGVRKATAAAVVASAFTAPHVTEFLTVDVTRTMRLLERVRADRDFADVSVSPLLLVAKALLVAVRRNPGVNATWDEAAGEIVTRHYVNLGIAVATPRGLVVPTVKDADTLTLRRLADALAAMTTTARQGHAQPADLAGGTISITNVGVFGVDSGTPILPPGQAAILCLGAIRQLPWVHHGKVKPRWVTQLALSFDHRLVDGDLGSRVLADVAAVLEHPGRALLWS